MRPAEAQVLAAKLAAAFPRDWAFTGEGTNAVYVENLSRLPRFEAGRDAVDALIRGELRLPPIAMIRDVYDRYHDLYSPAALPEPEMTEDELAENARRARLLTAHLAARGDHGHARDFESCTVEGCVELRTLSVPGAGQD